jgi:hypothetical protein
MLLLLLISTLEIARTADVTSPGCMWSTDCAVNGCESGSYCKVMVSYPATGGFSQCVENLVNIVAVCYPTSNGNYANPNYAYTRRGCTNSDQCCNEYATCGDDRLCHLSCTAGSDPSPPPTNRPKVEISLQISILFANSTVPFFDRSRSLAISAGIANTLDIKHSSVEVIDSLPKRRRLKELYVLTASAVISPTDDEVPTSYREDRPGLYNYYSSLLASLTIRNILLDEYQKELTKAGITGEPDLRILAIGTPAVPVTTNSDEGTSKAQTEYLGLDVSSFSAMISILGLVFVTIIAFTIYFFNRQKEARKQIRQGNSLSVLSMTSSQMKSSVDNVDLVIDNYSWRVPSPSNDRQSQDGMGIGRRQSVSRDGNGVDMLGHSLYNAGSGGGSSSSSCSWRLPSPRMKEADCDVNMIANITIAEPRTRSENSFCMDGHQPFDGDSQQSYNAQQSLNGQKSFNGQKSLNGQDTFNGQQVVNAQPSLNGPKPFNGQQSFNAHGQHSFSRRDNVDFASSLSRMKSSSSSSQGVFDLPPRDFDNIDKLNSQDTSTDCSDKDTSQTSSQESGTSFSFVLPGDQSNSHIHSGTSLDSEDGESIVIGIEGTYSVYGGSVATASVMTTSTMYS